MAKAKKLKSGNWRCLVYSHTDSKGKRIYESFTASTKAEAEAMAAQFKLDTDRKRTEDVTVKEAVENYLKARGSAPLQNMNTEAAKKVLRY